MFTQKSVTRNDWIWNEGLRNKLQTDCEEKQANPRASELTG